MCQVIVDIPNEVLYNTHMDMIETTTFARSMVALGYYVHNNVSIGYCAQIAGVSKEEFISFLGRNQIDIFQFDSDEELLKDVANA